MKLKVFKKANTEIMSEKEKLNLQIADNYVQNHGMPKTRRQFLASGLKASAAALFVPSIVETIVRSNLAHAAECTSVATKLPAAMVINGSGGYSVSGNFVFMGKDGDFLPSYSRLGLGATGAFNVDQTFGPQSGNFADRSQLLAGVLAGATPATIANTTVLGIAVQSQDDSSNNAFDPSGMLAEVLSGDFLPVLGQNRNMPAIRNAPAPLNVSRFSDVQNAVSVQGSIATMNQDAKSKLFRTISSLSNTQAQKLSSLSGGEALSQLTDSSTDTNVDLVAGGSGDISINPLDSTEFSTVWGLANDNDLNSGNGGNASAVYNALKGNASMAMMNIGGCDYHGNGRANQDAKDNEIGTMVGRMLESARILGRPTMIMITSDGAVASGDSLVPGADFTSDSGERGGVITFFYHPDKKPEQTARQLGHYSAGQGAVRETPVGGSPERAVAAAIVNYLSFAGRQDLIKSVTQSTFAQSDLDKITVIKG